ncbi:MAG TPA: hypothetical protein VMD91_00020 [Candidatus Sulfotelmatobacter sp.]|nr:hypothetical protein [Candidatus Sulfotelmatobacter sp.]
MDNLVLCPCGHALARHDFDGCAGDRLRRCSCPRDRHTALESAVELARNGGAPPVVRFPAPRSRGTDAA